MLLPPRRKHTVCFIECGRAAVAGCTGCLCVNSKDRVWAVERLGAKLTTVHVPTTRLQRVGIGPISVNRLASGRHIH